MVQDILSMHKESGTGSMTHPTPRDFDSAWQIVSRFELDPVVNVQSLSAMQVPVGLTPGRFQGLAQVSVSGERRYPKGCGSSMHDERIEITLPKLVRLVRLPTPRSYESAVLRYRSNYTQEGGRVIVTRHFVAQRPSPVCDSSDDQDWEAFGRVIRQDLRQQVFFEGPEAQSTP